MQTFTATVLVSLLLLTGCKTVEQTSQLKKLPPSISGQRSSAGVDWIGKWSGAWGKDGDCESSIEVHEVNGTTAVATYSWGAICGSGSTPAGSYTDDEARISGTILELYPPWWGVRYTMRDDGNLDGEWWLKHRKVSAEATFHRVASEE